MARGGAAVGARAGCPGRRRRTRRTRKSRRRQQAQAGARAQKARARARGGPSRPRRPCPRPHRARTPRRRAPFPRRLPLGVRPCCAVAAGCASCQTRDFHVRAAYPCRRRRRSSPLPEPVGRLPSRVLSASREPGTGGEGRTKLIAGGRCAPHARQVPGTRAPSSRGAPPLCSVCVWLLRGPRFAAALPATAACVTSLWGPRRSLSLAVLQGPGRAPTRSQTPPPRPCCLSAAVVAAPLVSADGRAAPPSWPLCSSDQQF